MIVDGNNVISHYLKNSLPLAAGKIGVTELNLLYCYYKIKEGGTLLPHLKHEAENIAGLYPYTKETVIQFAEQFLSLLPNIDLIPIWNRVIPQFEDFILKTYCPNSFKTTHEQLEPYFDEKPWTRYLKDKKVLVFSPFKESIDENFKNLNNIWQNKIENNFELKTYKYPFAIPIDKYVDTTLTSHDTYKKYLEILHKEDFDVGIFGTGYTSLLFTLECKRLKKAGIHLGGSTQILFGIKGQRWKEIERFKNIFNEYWTEPKASERPSKLSLVEDGCYW
jgi:hypothetical protein